MSANPSRWPRHPFSRGATPSIQPSTQFLPTLPVELDPLTRPRRAAPPSDEVWHDTQPQGLDDQELAALEALDALGSPLPADSPAPVAPPLRAATPVDSPDPLAGPFDEAVSGLQVRELDNDELFQRLFGPGR